MLVFTRKVDEGFWVGPDIFVEVTRIEGNKVRIGVTAPKDVAIVREEIDPGQRQRPPGHNRLS